MTGAGTSNPPMGSTTREQVIAVLVACAAGLLVLLVGGGGDDPVEVPAPTRASGPAEQAKTDEPAKPAEPAGHPARKDEPAAVYSPADPAYAYEVELPAGKAWSEPDETFKRSFDLLRTRVENDEGVVIAIDRTPNDIPAFTGNVDSTRTVSHPTFGEMTEYVFRFSTIDPSCVDDVCVDYLVEDGEGGGWGVLVGNAGVERGSAIARRVADTLQLSG